MRSLGRVTAVLAALSSACTDADTPGAAADVLPIDRATTAASTAWSNLDGAIEGLRARWTRHGRVQTRRALVEHLLLRARFTGRADDLAESERLAEAAVVEERTADAHRLRAGVHGALHRFDEALADLDAAADLGAEVATDVAILHIALGRDLAEAHDTLRTRAVEDPSYETLTNWGTAEAALGRWSEADALYVEAAMTYRNVSPFAVAWVDFQRGVMWAERAGIDGVSGDLYEAAVTRLPGYVTATVHLAELQPTRDAARGLRAVSDVDGDPEPFAVLAERLADDAPAEADQMRRKAERTYGDRLGRWPLAYADHAAEFYLGAGDEPERALELAALNLDNRQTDRAFDLAIRAADAAGDLDLACAWLREAGTDRPSAPLMDTRADVGPRCTPSTSRAL